jgi:hypothetical protein
MTFSPASSNRLLNIYLALGQYPILSGRIRARMRMELFERGIVQPQEFESEVRDKAIRSQEQEGLSRPLENEPEPVWEQRLNIIRDRLTDLYFSQHLSFGLFENIVRDILSERGVTARDHILSINLELAPQDMVFEQAMMIESMPPAERGKLEARLREAKVVLIRTIISDQLRYINVAKEWFTISDLVHIRQRKIGAGKIGGKAAGMLLAARILEDLTEGPMKVCLHTPESYFIGSDEMYNFMSINNLVHWNDQKYKSEEEMREEFPQIERDFLAGSFPPDLLQHLQTLLSTVGSQPLIVRSSSLLEDNFGTSFAGKYDSIFLPNQADPHQNLLALTRAIASIYASTLNPSALLYRRSRGLQDYDERMALLIQVVRGERFGQYFMPHGAGVAFSRNLYRWAPQIRREDGFVRMVWGMGTRAVDRVGSDYPRLVALSHPMLRPNTSPKLIQRYSQQFVDLIDLKDNSFKTLPISEVLDSHYGPLRYVAQVYEPEGYFTSLKSNVVSPEGQLVVTFEELLRGTSFADTMREMLHLLERSYRAPVDMEFTLHMIPGQDGRGKPNICIDILQCRPQSYLMDSEQVPLPSNLPPEKVVFATTFMVPQGCIEGVEWVVYVPYETYFHMADNASRVALARVIGKVNAALRGKNFICVGPGRWGSSNADLGVPVVYGDIYNARALVEVTGQGVGTGLVPEPSLGTHFFQDLLEAQIYPLALYLEDPGSQFQRGFFYDMPNHLARMIPGSEDMQPVLRLIHVPDFAPGARMKIVMNDDRSTAIAFLEERAQ